MPMPQAYIAAVNPATGIPIQEYVALVDGSGNFVTPTQPDGWTPPGETWTFASATTMTVPNGALYQKGDRLKLTQTTVKYFVVVGVSGNTLTITGGTDYTLVSAAITANFFSRQLSPLGYPTWFNFAAAASGFASITSAFTRFRVDGNVCTVFFNITGTSNATTFGFTAPIAQASLGAGTGCVLYTTFDASAGSATPGRAVVADATAAVTLNKDVINAVWTNTGTKAAGGVLAYEI